MPHDAGRQNAYANVTELDDAIFLAVHAAQIKAARARRSRSQRRPNLATAAGGGAAGTQTGVHGRLRLPAGSPTQQRGRKGEIRAAAWLTSKGVRVVGRNMRCKAGEIDLIAIDNGVLVFVEVRVRGSKTHGGAAASVTPRKQQRLLRAARYFLPCLARRHFGGKIPPCRFDVISEQAGELHWIRHAFSEPPD